MYPELLRLNGFVITSFGALVALGALVGLWLFGRELALVVAGLCLTFVSTVNAAQRSLRRSPRPPKESSAIRSTR